MGRPKGSKNKPKISDQQKEVLEKTPEKKGFMSSIKGFFGIKG